MKNIFIILISLPSLLIGQDYIGDYYISPDGNDNGPGTWEEPWATWEKAFDNVIAGDTVYIRGGIYYAKWDDHNRAQIHNSGTRDEPICFFAYPGEKPILDGDSLVYYLKPNPSGNIYNMAIVMQGLEYIKFKGLEIRHFYQYDYESTGATWLPNYGVIRGGNTANLTFEDISIHDCGVKGYYIASGFWNDWDSTFAVDNYGTAPRDAIAYFDYDTTRWINCDVYNMADPYSDPPGDHADCWKAENFQGSVFSWENCRGWNYTDDGIDANHAGYKIFDNVWLMSGPKYSSLEGFEGNGFKITANSSETYFPQHLSDTNIVKYNNCIVMFSPTGWLNDFFIDVPEGLTKLSTNAYFKNCLGYANQHNFDAPVAKGDSILNITVKNSIMFGATDRNPCGKPSDINMLSFVNAKNAFSTGDYRNNIYYSGYENAGCGRWDYNTASFTVSSDDFVYGLDSLTLVSLFTAPREESTNALPLIKPFALSPDSDLIDAGTDVGLPYIGAAPDVGPFEYNPSGNNPPSIELLSPRHKDTYSSGETINIRINPNDNDGFITKVIIYNNSEVLKTIEGEPWRYDWTDAPLGTHLLRAVAIDNQDGRISSKTISISVSSEGQLFPNPNYGKFSLQLHDPLPLTNRYEIISLNGRVVFSGNKAWDYLNTFDLAFLEKGLYILKIPNYLSIAPQKFLKLEY